MQRNMNFYVAFLLQALTETRSVSDLSGSSAGHESSQADKLERSISHRKYPGVKPSANVQCPMGFLLSSGLFVDDVISMAFV